MGKRISKERISKETQKEIKKALKEAEAHPEIPKCKLVLCIDPTGKEKPTMKPEGECPEGYIEKVAVEVKKKGLAFEM